MRINPYVQVAQQKIAEQQSKGKVLTSQSLEKGQVIKGEVLDATHHQVKILLSSGETIDAYVSGEKPMIIGEKIEFLVKEKGPEQLLLMALNTEEEGMQPKIEAILDNGQLSKTEANKTLVGHLLEAQLPVDKESLKETLLLLNKHPEIEVDKLLFLIKNKISVNETSLQQFQVYTGSGDKLVHQLAKMTSELSLMIGHDETGLLMPIKQGLLEQEPQLMTISNQLEGLIHNLDKEHQIGVSKESSHLFSKEQNIQLDEILPAQDVIKLTKEVLGLIGQKSAILPSLTEGQALALSKFQAGPGLSTQTLMSLVEEKLIESSDLKALLVDVDEAVIQLGMNRSLLMSKQDIQSKLEVQIYFQKVYDKINTLLSQMKILSPTEDLEEESVNQVKQVKSSLEMLHSLNQPMNFFHMPMFLDDKLLNSELYVMNNKKSAKKEGDPINALLRLDLLNLGHLDVYINKHQKNLDIRMMLKDEEQIKEFRENIKPLQHILTQKGFNVLGLLVAPIQKDFDVFDDFLKLASEKESKERENQGQKRYSFDMRA